jgi:hypothetical protein
MPSIQSRIKRDVSAILTLGTSCPRICHKILIPFSDGGSLREALGIDRVERVESSSCPLDLSFRLLLFYM